MAELTIRDEELQWGIEVNRETVTVEVAATLDRAQLMNLTSALHYAAQRLPLPPMPPGLNPF